MTRKLVRALVGAVLLNAALVATASAYSIGGTDVGGEDSLLGVATNLPNSSEASETAWVNSILGGLGAGPANFVTRIDSGAYSAVDGAAGIFAAALPGTPGYFVLKNATGWALFSNTANLGYAVFGMSPELASELNLKLGDGTISHISVFSGQGTQVPEPGTLGLLGLAVAGLGLVRRRRVA